MRASYSASLLVLGSVMEMACLIMPPFGVTKTKPIPTLTLGISDCLRGSNEDAPSKYNFQKGVPSSMKRTSSPGNSHSSGELSGTG